MRNQSGSSLIEVLAAVAILSFALVYSMSSTDRIVVSAHSAQDMAKANNIAIGVMEELLSVYDSDLKLTNGDHDATFDRDGRPVAADPYFTARWRVAVDTPITKILDIRLTVEWLDNGMLRYVQLQTFRGG